MRLNFEMSLVLLLVASLFVGLCSADGRRRKSMEAIKVVTLNIVAMVLINLVGVLKCDDTFFPIL